MDDGRISQLILNNDWLAEYLDVGGYPVSYAYVIGFAVIEMADESGLLDQAIVAMELNGGCAQVCDTQEGFNRIVPRDSIATFVPRPHVTTIEDIIESTIN